MPAFQRFPPNSLAQQSNFLCPLLKQFIKHKKINDRHPINITTNTCNPCLAKHTHTHTSHPPVRRTCLCWRRECRSWRSAPPDRPWSAGAEMSAQTALAPCRSRWFRWVTGPASFPIGIAGILILCDKKSDGQKVVKLVDIAKKHDGKLVVIYGKYYEKSLRNCRKSTKVSIKC